MSPTPTPLSDHEIRVIAERCADQARSAAKAHRIPITELDWMEIAEFIERALHRARARRFGK